MKLVYQLGTALYTAGLRLAVPFNQKAKLRHNGLTEQKTVPNICADKQSIWFHCASLGEFEQARPIIERIKAELPDSYIILTFFSPSGFEMRKNYAHADTVLYLPPDSPKNAKLFVNSLKPDLVFWIKYEFWYNYLNEIASKKIPLFLISAVFRENQLFFKPHGKIYRKMLSYFSEIFVQDDISLNLLTKIGLKNVTRAGDTRIDRVLRLPDEGQRFPKIETFVNDSLVLVAGSTWHEDEHLLMEYLRKHQHIKAIIAPHEIGEQHLQKIEESSTGIVKRYSRVSSEEIKSAQILLIDNIGMLSVLYRYARFAYIGGGFGAGIHNTLEPAVFGKPVVFGPKFKKFTEAVELVKQEAFFSISDYQTLENCFDSLFGNTDLCHSAGVKARTYTELNKGATDVILKHVGIVKKP